MSLSKLYFTKNWENPADFPTFEDREAQVRADLQLLHDETKAAFNKLIDDLAASEIPFSPTAAIAETDVQSAIENVQSQVAGLVLDELVIPDRSITGDKLALKAVGTDELNNGAVTTAKLGPGAVTSAKIGTGEVKRTNVADGAINDDKMAANAPTYKADLDGGIVTRTQLRLRKKTINNTSYTLTASDAGAVIGFHGNSITVPNTNQILPGTVIVITAIERATMFFKGDASMKFYAYGRGNVGDYFLIPAGGTAILINIDSANSKYWAIGALSAGMDIS